MDYYIGVDIGTTQIKTGILDESGYLVGLHKTDTPADRDDNGDFYDPEWLFHIVESQLSKALKDYPTVQGIGITGMAEAGLMVDRKTGNELTKIIPWYDKRTLPYSEPLTQAEDIKNFDNTGLRNSFKYGIYKYLWSLEYCRAERSSTLWLSVCDYIYARLTGEICTEPTFAARTYVYDIRKQNWDTERLALWGLSENNFPRLVDSGLYAGYLKGTKIPVALCGHDHVCSAYGMIQRKGQICNSCGTAETFIGMVENLRRTDGNDSGLVYGPYLENGRFFGMANLSSSGQSLEWMRKQVQDQTLSYERINELLEKLPDGIGDILYFPYLSGMGSPLFKASATGAMLGLKAHHNTADLLRAVIEGVGYQAKWILDKGFQKDISEIIAVGGSTKIKWWMQCKASILNKKITVADMQEGTLFGAVALIRDKNGQPGLNKEIRGEIFWPDGPNAKSYERIYRELFMHYAEMISQFSY